MNFKDIIDWIKKMFGLSSKITEELSVEQSYYTDYIAVWKQIYSGYYEKWHKVSTTVKDKKRKMSTMQVAKLICEEMTRLTFTEKVQIKINPVEGGSDEQVKPFSDLVSDTLKKNKFHTNMCELTEYAYAMGGAALKPYVQDGVIMIDYTQADSFLPIGYNNKGIFSGVFLTRTIKGQFEYMLAETREYMESEKTVKGSFKLYKRSLMSGGATGKIVDLAELYPNLEPEYTITGADTPLFAYFRPNIANNIDTNSPLGISVFANALDTLKSLDICFDSLQREFVLGKKRIIVPSHMLSTVEDTDGTTYRYLDNSVDVYEGLNIDDQRDMLPTDNTQVLRVEEHVKAINAFLNILCVQIGVTPGFISFDQKTGLKTATEVISENSKTYTTKANHEVQIGESIEQLVRSIYDIAVTFGMIGETEFEVEIKFDDSIIENKDKERQQDSMDVAGGIMNKWEYRVKWYGEDEETAKKMVETNEIILE